MSLNYFFLSSLMVISLIKKTILVEGYCIVMLDFLHTTNNSMGYFFYYAHGSITVIQYKFLQTGKKKSCLHQCLRPEYKHSNRTQAQSLPLQSFPIKRPHSSLNNGLYFEMRYLLIRSPPYQFPFLQNGIRNQYRHAKYSNQNPGILNDT